MHIRTFDYNNDYNKYIAKKTKVFERVIKVYILFMLLNSIKQFFNQLKCKYVSILTSEYSKGKKIFANK